MLILNLYEYANTQDLFLQLSLEDDQSVLIETMSCNHQFFL